jgi:hypothetical protein
MRYPRYLLPERYFRIFSLDELDYSSDNYFVLRRSACAKGATFDRFGTIAAEALLGLSQDTGGLNLKELQGLSMNILGGKFLPSHLEFRQLGKANNYWPQFARVSYQEISNLIETTPEDLRVPIFYQLKHLHNQPLPYFRQVDSNFKKKIPKEFTLQTGIQELQAVVRVNHKPTYGNYWHVELSFKDVLSDEDIKRDKISNNDLLKAESQRKDGTKLAISILENLMMVKGKTSVQQVRSIDRKFYNYYVFCFYDLTRRLHQRFKKFMQLDSGGL